MSFLRALWLGAFILAPATNLLGKMTSPISMFPKSDRIFAGEGMWVLESVDLRPTAGNRIGKTFMHFGVDHAIQPKLGAFKLARGLH